MAFTRSSISSGDKDIDIFQTDCDEGQGLRITVDYDDVDHETIKRKAERMLYILNKYW